MRMNRTALTVGGPILLSLVLAACVGVRIDRDVADPDAAFARAEGQIGALESGHPGRAGHAHKLYLMAYDGDDRELVRISVPLWLVDVCLDLAEGSDHADKVHRLEDRYDVDWKALGNLGRFGPGLLVSIEEKRSRVLIWLQ